MSTITETPIQSASDYQKKDLPVWLNQLGWTVFFIGVAATLLAFFFETNRSYYNFVMMLMFIGGTGAAALFVCAIEYITGAIWSVPLRRIFELVSKMLLFVPLFALPIIIFGMHDLYEWTHTAAAYDPVLVRKSSYLNENFFIIRTALICGLWILFHMLMVGNSKKQDTTGDQSFTTKNVKLSAIYIPVFALSITFFCMDYMMSLEPHWFSTIFGVNFFAGSLLSAFAIATIIIVLLNENGYLGSGILKDHYYSLGFGMFAATVFWTYTAFSQGMLIWYANLAEETPWYFHRWEGSWKWVTIAMIFINFLIPFCMLIQRKSKTNPTRLIVASIWILFAHMFDLFWIAMPAHDRANAPVIGATFSWVEAGFICLTIGFVMVLFLKMAQKYNLVAVGDPKLKRGLDFRM